MPEEAANSQPAAFVLAPDLYAAIAPGHFYAAHLRREEQRNTEASDAQKGSCDQKSRVIRDGTHAKLARRPNGRALLQPRQAVVSVGSLAQCSGSAVVRQGGTVVTVGVRAEVLAASDVVEDGGLAAQRAMATNESKTEINAASIQRLGLLVPNVDLRTGCHPLHMPGSAPSASSQTLAWIIRELLLTADFIQLKDLEIYEGTLENQLSATDDASSNPRRVRGYWTLYIDAVVLSHDGSLLDALWATVVAAVHTTRIPRAYWDMDLNSAVADDLHSQPRLIVPSSARCPATLSFAMFAPGPNPEEDSLLLDPDAFEEDLCRESGWICVNAREQSREHGTGTVDDERQSAVLAVRSAGGAGAACAQHIGAIARAAAKRSIALRRSIKEALQVADRQTDQGAPPLDVDMGY
jgi:exosome complex component RRP43